MKTFSEAMDIFTSGTQEHPAKDMTEARQMAIKAATFIRQRYGHLDDEIRANDMAQRLMWAYVVAFTKDMEDGDQPSAVLLNLAFSCFRHGLIVGCEMERRELDEDKQSMETETKEEPTKEERRVPKKIFRTSTERDQDWDTSAKRQDFPVTSRQVKKLLTMLSMAELIDSWFEDRERVWDEDAAVHWVRQTIGVKVQELSGLTQKQIGRCFEELGE